MNSEVIKITYLDDLVLNFDYKLWNKMFGDEKNLYKAAWILKYGVIDSAEKWNWKPFVPLYIPDYQYLGRITLQQALMRAMTQIGNATEQLSEGCKEDIDDILEGGETFNSVSSLVSDELKHKLRP